MNVIIALLKQ